MNWKFWTSPAENNIHPRPQIQLRPLPEHELRAGFAEAPHSALWRSVQAELDEFIIEVSDRPLSETLSDATMRFHVGGQAALVEFKDRLNRREAEARQANQPPES